MMEYKCLLPLVLPPCTDTSAENILAVAHHHGLSFYISSNDNILLRIHDADSFPKIDKKLNLFNGNAFYRQEEDLFGKSDLRLSERREGRLPSFV